jgi:hypothetical protein
VDLGYGWTVVEVAVGGSHTCARLENGAARALKCWWFTYDGRADGGGEMGDSLPAVQLGTGRSAVSLALGHKHSCALLDDGSVKCWGDNSKGRLGLGDTIDRGNGGGGMGDSLPAVDLGAGRIVVQLATYDGHTCAVLDGGQLCVPRPLSLTWTWPGCFSLVSARVMRRWP